MDNITLFDKYGSEADPVVRSAASDVQLYTANGDEIRYDKGNDAYYSLEEIPGSPGQVREAPVSLLALGQAIGAADASVSASTRTMRGVPRSSPRMPPKEPLKEGEKFYSLPDDLLDGAFEYMGKSAGMNLPAAVKDYLRAINKRRGEKFTAAGMQFVKLAKQINKTGAIPVPKGEGEKRISWSAQVFYNFSGLSMERAFSIMSDYSFGLGDWRGDMGEGREMIAAMLKDRFFAEKDTYSERMSFFNDMLTVGRLAGGKNIREMRQKWGESTGRDYDVPGIDAFRSPEIAVAAVCAFVLSFYLTADNIANIPEDVFRASEEVTLGEVRFFVPRRMSFLDVCAEVARDGWKLEEGVKTEMLKGIGVVAFDARPVPENFVRGRKKFLAEKRAKYGFSGVDGRKVNAWSKGADWDRKEPAYQRKW